MKVKYIIPRLKTVLIVTLFLFAACNSRSIEQEYYENGNIKITAETINGELNGTLTEYNESGGIKYISHYKNGVQQGESRWLDEKGNVIEVQHIVEGKATTGKATPFYHNGKPKSVILYVNNKIHGAFVKYYSNGKKKIEGTMRFGKPVGKVVSYDSLGHIINECFYDSLGIKRECNYFPTVKE